jgi:hypothetical protein
MTKTEVKQGRPLKGTKEPRLHCDCYWRKVVRKTNMKILKRVVSLQPDTITGLTTFIAYGLLLSTLLQAYVFIEK